MNNVAEVESRAELVRAMPRCSNVSKKHRTSRRRSAVIISNKIEGMFFYIPRCYRSTPLKRGGLARLGSV